MNVRGRFPFAVGAGILTAGLLGVAGAATAGPSGADGPVARAAEEAQAEPGAVTGHAVAPARSAVPASPP
ncbi:hypothetical protein ACIBK8_11175 [Streptomyces sp. NPDC050161]|uniref:hypothetical protein n=1 Tax=Streptomyces sp. NPDC050161 TaxID=3365604 RepID=UPI0037ACA578